MRKEKPMRIVQRVTATLMLFSFLLGCLSAFAPLAAHAGSEPIKIGPPIIVKDPPKSPPPKGG